MFGYVFGNCCGDMYVDFVFGFGWVDYDIVEIDVL